MLPAPMPFKLVPPPPFYPPLRQVYRAVDHGRQTAIIFLVLLAVAGFLGMGFMVAIEVLGLILNPGRDNDPIAGAWGLCTLLDVLTLGLSLHQIRNRHRSWIPLRVTAVTISCALALAAWGLFHEPHMRMKAIAMILAFHTGSQILSSGALLALRRIPWTGEIPEEQRQRRSANPLDF
jgi:hypothetical protein